MNKKRLLTLMGGSKKPWYLAGGSPSPVAAYQPKGAASLAASYVNLVNPGTYDATVPVAAPTWNATDGWIFNASEYLDTGLTIANGSTWSFIARFVVVGNGNGGVVGGFAGAGETRFFVRPDTGSSQRSYGAGGYLAKSPNVASGVMAICANHTYLNGSPDGDAGAWSGTNTYSLYVGATNGSSLGLVFRGKVQAMAIYNSVLTAAQVASITESINF